MAKEKNDYLINKVVKVLTKSGDKVEVGHVRSHDGRVIYFNPTRGIGQAWLDSLEEAVDQVDQAKYEFA